MEEPKLEILPPSALESISRAEIDVSVSTARKFPRQLSVVKQSMMSFATMDQETAESCFYSLPRGGKNIQGPSVRLAEIAVSCYGNLRVGSRVIETVTDGPNPHVTVQAVAMDLEKNVSVSIEKRRRITKKKSKDTIDEDDITLAANAGAAIAFRDSVWKIVPLALVKPVFEAAKKTAIGDIRTLTDRRARCLDTFAKMGISKERVLARLGKRSIEDIGLDDIETMLGLFNAIKDGEANVDESFPAVAQAPAPMNAPGSPEPVQPQAQPASAVAPAVPEQTTEVKADENAEADMGIAPLLAFTPIVGESAGLTGVRRLLHGARKSETDLVAFLKARKVMKPEQNKLSDLSEAKLEKVAGSWSSIGAELGKV